MDEVILPPELERFADEAVAAGRFHSRSDLVAAGVRLLQRTQAQLEQLQASVLTAEAFGEQNGFLTIDEVMRDADALIQEMTGTVP